MPLVLRVNGRTITVDAAPHHTLLDVLRTMLQLTGTKECCAEGECGACYRPRDGRAVCSCLVLAVEADGQDVTTIEGLGARGRPRRAAAGLRRDRRGAMRILHSRA